MNKVISLILCIFTVLLAIGFEIYSAWKPTVLQRSSRYVYIEDAAKILSEKEKQELTTKAKELENKTYTQVFVVTVVSLDGVPISKYSETIFDEWKINKNTNGRGILIVLSKDNNKLDIKLGRDFKDRFSDDTLKAFTQTGLSEFLNKNYNKAVSDIFNNIANELYSKYENDKKNGYNYNSK